MKKFYRELIGRFLRYVHIHRKSKDISAFY